jgi:RHS repeat-associated protein
MHKHSGIGYVTPQSLHSGQAHEIRQKRQRVLAQAHEKHPERFVLEELSTPNGTPSMSYIIGDDVLGQSAGTNPSWLLYDGHGSTRQLLHSSGSVSKQFNYDAYGGSLTTLPDSQDTSLLYAGEQYDSTLQQYYLRARYYNPVNGRFNRMDPFTGNRGEPASLHKYAYGSLDPVNLIDPTGMYSLTDIMGSVTISITNFANLGLRVVQAFNYAQRVINMVDFLMMLRDLSFSLPRLSQEIGDTIKSLSGQGAPNKFKNMSLDTVEQLFLRILRDSAEISMLIARKHGKRFAEALGTRKRGKSRRDRFVIFLPTLHGAYKKDNKRKRVPGLLISGLPVALAFGGRGGRVTGFGLAKKTDPQSLNYQLFRLDWHDSQIKHDPPWTSYFELDNGEEYHWHVPETRSKALGINNGG